MARPDHKQQRGPAEVVRVFLKLGCTSFGGPIAHLGYFQNELVARRHWLGEEEYADLVALCQFLPGPLSSQVGLAIGWRRSGWKGAAAAWIGFTLPSAVLMFAFATVLRSAGSLAHTGWMQGLKIAAAAVVAQAVIMMAKRLCPDLPRAAIALAVAVTLTLFSPSWMQLVVIAAGAAAGYLGRRWYRAAPPAPAVTTPLEPAGQTLNLPTSLEPADRSTSAPDRKTAGLLCLGLYVGLLAATPFLARLWPAPGPRVFDAFYRTGALVFGGGHVVLPLLHQATVDRGWLTQDAFLTGYGAAQALPGPLFAFAAYLGAIIAPGGIGGALLALVALYLPAALTLFAALPQWERLRHMVEVRYLLAGANAAVVGLLAAAFYSPIWTSSITDPKRFALALAAFAALQFLRAPSWMIVLLCAGAGAAWLQIN